MTTEKINLAEKLRLISDHWAPRVVAEINDYQVKLVKIEGEFTWHRHEDTDEAFLVISGRMGIEFRDRAVELEEGEMIVVPRGSDHKPFAENECHVMIIEPRGVPNTGDAGGPLTAEGDVWI